MATESTNIRLLRINRKKKKRRLPLPKIINIYGTFIVFFNKLVWCPYGVPTELEGSCPPTPPHVGVLSVESLHLSVSTTFAFAVDSSTVVGVFHSVIVVVVHYFLIMGKQSATFAPTVFVIYDFFSFLV